MPMRRINEIKPMEGLEVVNPKQPKIRYMASSKFVMVEFEVDEGNEYISVYLRPYEQNKTLITAYLPELGYIEDLRVYNKPGLLKFLCRSNKFSKIYKDSSKIGSKPFISKIEDFTRKESGSKVICLQKVVDVPLTPKVIDEQYPEYNKLEDGINEIIAVIVDYLNIYIEHIRDLDAAMWTLCVNKSIVKTVLNKSIEDHNFWGPFINHIDNIDDEDIRELIKEYKVAIWCKSNVYGISVPINEEDKQQDAHFIVLVEVFEPSFKDSGYFFYINLEHRYGSWVPKADLDGLVERISIMLNHVNKKKWAKISESIYKYMPKTTDLWFYSNPYHEGAMLHRFVREGDQTDYGVDEPFYKVEEPNFIKGSYWGSVNCDDPWNGEISLHGVSDTINLALTVISEYQRYYPVWKKKRFINIGLEAIKILANPYKYGMKKIIGMK